MKPVCGSGEACLSSVTQKPSCRPSELGRRVKPGRGPGDATEAWPRPGPGEASDSEA